MHSFQGSSLFLQWPVVAWEAPFASPDLNIMWTLDLMNSCRSPDDSGSKTTIANIILWKASLSQPCPGTFSIFIVGIYVYIYIFLQRSVLLPQSVPLHLITSVGFQVLEMGELVKRQQTEAKWSCQRHGFWLRKSKTSSTTHVMNLFFASPFKGSRAQPWRLRIHRYCQNHTGTGPK